MMPGQNVLKKDCGMRQLPKIILTLISMLQERRNDDEIFPWDFIDTGVTKRFLLSEWHNAQNEKVTPNCRMQCSGCGAASFGGGVCYEN